MTKTIEAAIRIARRDLRSCYTRHGLLTGSRKVYWSWDSFFAGFGALALGDFKVVKKNLELYLRLQRRNGLLPKRIAHPLYALRFVGLPIREEWLRQKPNYRTAYYSGFSLAQNPTFLIAFCQYIEESGDLKFLSENWLKLEKAISVLKKYCYRSGLLREKIGGGWAESVLKRGAITFTNICFARSLFCLGVLARKLGREKDSARYERWFKRVVKAINKRLWSEANGGFYSDWVGFSRHHHFTSDGNLLAIWWGIAGRRRARAIEKRLDEMLAAAEVPLPLTLDKYFWWRIFFLNHLGGMKNYHASFSWTWLASAAALAKLKLKKKKEAVEILERIAKAIVRDRTVHEIYYGGKPVNLFFYKSEKPWAWAAGLFLYTASESGFNLRV